MRRFLYPPLWYDEYVENRTTRPVESHEKNKLIRVKNDPHVPERLRGKEGVLWEVSASTGMATFEVSGQIERLPQTDIEVVEAPEATSG